MSRSNWLSREQRSLSFFNGRIKESKRVQRWRRWRLFPTFLVQQKVQRFFFFLFPSQSVFQEQNTSILHVSPGSFSVELDANGHSPRVLCRGVDVFFYLTTHKATLSSTAVIPVDLINSASKNRSSLLCNCFLLCFVLESRRNFKMLGLCFR